MLYLRACDVLGYIFASFNYKMSSDLTTGRICFGIATTHDFEGHDHIIEERLYLNILASHFVKLPIIFLWTSENLFHFA